MHHKGAATPYSSKTDVINLNQTICATCTCPCPNMCVFQNRPATCVPFIRCEMCQSCHLCACQNKSVSSLCISAPPCKICVCQNHYVTSSDEHSTTSVIPTKPLQSSAVQSTAHQPVLQQPHQERPGVLWPSGASPSVGWPTQTAPGTPPCSCRSPGTASP